jgi:Xaa-Pro aminopeptidase
MTDFPVDEYELRLMRMQAIMERRGLDAVILSEYNNFRYFAGFNSPFSAWTGYIRTRPFFCIISRKHSPVLIVHASFAKATRDMTWTDDVVEWVDLPFDMKIVEDCLVRLGLHHDAVIGFELGGEQRFCFPPIGFLQLQQRLPKVSMIDAADALTELRLIKSSREIACIREACLITDTAYRSLFDSLKVGDSELEIDLRMRQLMTTINGEGPNFVLTSIHPGGVTGRKPSSRVLRKGDVLWMDAGAIFNGYRSDFSRVALVGGIRDEQRAAYDLVREVTMQVVSKIRPGVKVAELDAFCAVELKSRGIPPKKAGRIGHGIGLDTGEAPSVMGSDPTVLKQGMVFTIEPGYLADFGYFVLEEICAVTESGFELLTVVSDKDPPVIF